MDEITNLENMHLFLITRGINQNVDIWKMYMQTQMFPWKRKRLDNGKEELNYVQGALRPIQLWEYVFPEEHLAEVLTMLKKTKDTGGEGYFGKGKTKMARAALRKILGAEKLPEIDSVPTSRFIFMDGVGVEAIGIKKDDRRPWNKYGYEQEML